MRRLIYATALTLSFSLQAEAQMPSNALRGLSQIHLVIEPLNGNDITCGLTEEAIRAAVLFPASSARFQITNPFVPTVLYVQTTTLFFGPQHSCVTNINMRVYSWQEVTLNFSGGNAFARIELWNTGYIIGGPQSGHPRRIAQVIEDLTKKFVTDWNFDNKAFGN